MISLLSTLPAALPGAEQLRMIDERGGAPSCIGEHAGRTLVWTRVQIIEMNGEEPGVQVQVFDRRIKC